MSLYARYIAEREGKGIVETDIGYATYSFHPDGVYIEDIYVLPEQRRSCVASELADSVCDVAKKAGYKKLYGSVCPEAKGSTESLKILLAYGMRLHSAKPGMIFFIKDLE